MEIRYALPEDIPGMATVYVDTWKAAYQGMIPQEYLHGLSYAGWEENARAQRVYERFGFARDGARKSQEFSGTPVWEIRYRLDFSDQA